MLESIMAWISRLLLKFFGSQNERTIKALSPTAEAVAALEPRFEAMTDLELSKVTPGFLKRLDSGETLDDILPEAFAAVREASKRVLGMRHFDVQVIGGIVLHQGNISEMVTGEGKTLVATMPAYLNAIEGKGVHVVTVNDYLAQRDEHWMGPVFELLGLTVGCIQQDMRSIDRRANYACHITYGTNNEYGFDYLRDNMKVRADEQCQRSRHYAIVDEVDSILIDEARTPLIISGPAEKSTSKYYEADRIVRRVPSKKLILKTDYEIRKHPEGEETLEARYFFVVDEKGNQVNETAAGQVWMERQSKIGPLQDESDELEAEIQALEKELAEMSFQAQSTERAEREETIRGRRRKLYTSWNRNNLEINEWRHHLNQALRAHMLYKKDHHYVNMDGGIVIVDEFTGRLMAGRRWSDGLHQAIEAKERLKIQEENQTLATITFQNYFKLYDKVAGMTGTALTEAAEFDKTYKLDVIIIPTNCPLIRRSYPDVIYASEEEKYEALVNEIVKVHATGRPILVGTLSIERSEKIGAMLGRRGVEHEVLNAKHHEREAYIVSSAGEMGRVTIATNMAGRGTDIVLGKFSMDEYLSFIDRFEMAPHDVDSDLPYEELRHRVLAHWGKMYLGDESPADSSSEEIEARLEKASWTNRFVPPHFGRNVAELGGLHIIGSERHEARRIDNQLRGRAGRQGDPGSNQFFLSLDDDIMRIVARDWVKGFLQKLGMKDGQDITSPMVSRSIERAQRKVEAHNFEIRKNLLEYDEVMNEQRTLIYDMRQDVLSGANQRDRITEMMEWVVGAETDMRLGHETMLIDLLDWFEGAFGIPLGVSEVRDLDRDQLVNRLIDRLKVEYDKHEEEVGDKSMRFLERYLLLQTIDTKWKDHLYAMDKLKEGIGLRGYGQLDPKIEYKKEGYTMFGKMLDQIRQEIAGTILRVRLSPEAEEEVSSVWNASEFIKEEAGSDYAKTREQMEAASNQSMGGEKPKPIRAGEKIGRNDPCPCGSGKKYKKCCG
jgi:preprotein translocase subunit SecA